MAVVGDDPAAKSSTVPSSSDATMVDLHMPILFPGDVQEALDLSRHAVALSRACGLWAGLSSSPQSPTATARSTSTPIVSVRGARRRGRRQPVRRYPNGRLLTPYTLDMEIEFQQVRSVLARQYGVDNHLNAVSVRSSDDWIGHRCLWQHLPRVARGAARCSAFPPTTICSVRASDSSSC